MQQLNRSCQRNLSIGVILAKSPAEQRDRRPKPLPAPRQHLVQHRLQGKESPTERRARACPQQSPNHRQQAHRDGRGWSLGTSVLWVSLKDIERESHMVTHKLGQLEAVDLRTIWGDESRDFTPWLAENLDQLGEALGLDLQLLESESGIGPFAVDVLAEEDETFVVIENQLERTDHTHLGQLLTYAAGRDARTLIWITPDFRDEHRAVLDWLNRWTTGHIKVFGVEVRAVRIGDSLPAPEFRPVAFPNTWSRQVRSQTARPEMSDDERNRRIEFFSTLASRAQRQGLSNSTGFSSVAKSKSFPCRVDESGLKYWVDLRTTGVVTVCLDVRTGDIERNAAIISGLEKDELSIQEELGFRPELFPPDPDGPHGRIAGRVMRIREASIDDPPDRIEETLEWCLEGLAGFQRVLEPRLREIIDDLDSKEA